MELTQLTPAALGELIQLVEKKQALLDQIAKVEAEMESVVTGKAAPARAATAKAPRTPAAPKAAPAPKEVAAPKAATPGRAKRGALKEGILAALEAAGPEGLAVSDLSARLGVEPANVHVWFSTTGKKLPGITKVAAGRYALGAATSIAAAVAAAEPALAPVEELATTLAEEVPAAIGPEPEVASTPAVEPEPVAAVEETPVIEPVIEEEPVAESTIELEPEASALSPDESEAPVAHKNDELLLSSD